MKRGEAEPVLDADPQLLRAIVESSSDAICVKDLAGHYVYVNRPAADLLGESPADIIGKADAEFFPARAAEEIRRTDLEVMKGEERRVVEETVTVAGRVVVLESVKTPHRAQTGEVIGLIGVSRDITARKRAERDLRTAHDELEDRVEERTGDLIEAMRKMEAEIAERKRAENRLKESERRFRAIFDQAFEFVGLLTPDGTVVEANRTALDFVGAELSEVVGRPFWETPWWEPFAADQGRLRQGIEEAAEGRLVRFETQHRSADGEVRAVDFSLTPVNDESGRVVLLIPEGRDITERKQMEDNLRQMSKVFTETVDPIFIKDLAGTVIDMNRAAERQYGWSREELLGQPIKMTVPREWHWREEELMERCKRGERIQNAEALRMRKSGESFPVLISMSLLTDEAGQPFAVAKMSKDISDLKQAETELRESEERHRLAVSGARQGLWDLDLVSGELYISPEGKAMLGYGEGQSVTPADQLAKVHPEDRDRVQEAMEAHLADRSPRYAEEFRVPLADGSSRWILGRGIALRDRAGIPIRMTGTFSDITERHERFEQEVVTPLLEIAGGEAEHKVERELDMRVSDPRDELHTVGTYLRGLSSRVHETRTRLEESRTQLRAAEQLAAVGRLAASVAHEIRNPLTSIQIRLHSLEDAADGDPDLEEDCQVIADEMERLEEIVSDFLEFARPRDLKLAVCRLSSLVRTVQQTLGPEMQKKGTELQYEDDPALPPVEVDPAQLKQVFINLVRNALEVVEPGGSITITADTEIGDAGELLSVSFHDDGSGVPEHLQPRIFDPFFTTKESGSGLGLCICAQIMERHGGSISLEQTSPRGTTFAVKIPVSSGGTDGQDPGR